MSYKRILGLWNLDAHSSFHTPLDSRRGRNLIKKAYRSGITTFDTAYSYHEADSYLASAMRELQTPREKITIISKVMPVPTLQEKAEASLRRLRSDYLDILLLHWPTGERELFRALEKLEELQESGKALEIGVSNFPFSMLEKVSKDFALSYSERPLSLLWTRDYDKERKLPLTTLAYAPLGMGLLSGRYQTKEETQDQRATLYIQNERLSELLALEKKLAGKYQTTMAEIALSFVSSLDVFGIIQGYSREEDIKEEKETVLSAEDLLELTLLSEKAQKDSPSDNIFGHDYLLN